MTTEPIIDFEKITSAISAKNPTGDSATYEDEFEIIDQEIAKLSAITQEDVDWQAVYDNCQKLLTTKTKDLLLASYFSASLFEIHGYQGLKEGLQILEKLTTEFWDSLYPALKRMRGRAAAINWLNKRLINILANKKPVPSDHESLEEIFRIIGDLDQFYSVEITDNTPSFAELSRQLNEYRASIQPPTKKSATTASNKNEADTTTIKTKEQPPENSSKDEVITSPTNDNNQSQVAATNQQSSQPTQINQADIASSYRQAQQTIKSLVNDLRAASLNNPQHFYLNRVATWLSVTEVPMNTSNKTQLQAPATEIVSSLQSKIESGDLENAITEIESLIPQSPLWLDAQRLVVVAMEEMGRPYETAAIIVKSQTFALIQRLPALLKMQFADGTPFASEQFKSWYKNESAGSSETTTPTVQTSLDAELIKKIHVLTSKGKLDKALALIQTAINQGCNVKQRFLLLLLQAESCGQCDRFDLAQPMYSQLDQEQKKYKLEEWEPELATQILLGLLKTLRASAEANSEAGTNTEEQQVFNRLCLLQPAIALGLKSL